MYLCSYWFVGLCVCCACVFLCVISNRSNSNTHVRPRWVKSVSTVKYEKLIIAFYLPKNTKCLSHFSDLKLHCASILWKSISWKLYLIENGGQSPMGNNFNKNFNFSPFSQPSIFVFKALALNWSQVFHRPWNVSKWSLEWIKCFENGSIQCFFPKVTFVSCF